jgi:hypothetical protein
MTPVSFTQISALFTPRDTLCMNPKGVLLTDYDYMSDDAGDGTYADHANANHVYARLTGTEQPQMPMGGPFWTQTNLDLFDQWMQDGYQP